MTHVVLIAGPVRWDDRKGHHDYLAGCRLLADCLCWVPGVAATVVANGWPEDDAAILDTADAVVFYDGGNGKQQYLKNEKRVDTLHRLADRGVGLCFFHQAAVFPARWRRLGEQWLGAAYMPAFSARGHWRCRQSRLPAHDVFRGVTPWALRDGWLNGFQFTDRDERITPLVHASRKSVDGNDASHRVSWFYDRQDGGVSFVFTGLDSHRAWHQAGLRRLIANSVLWTAGLVPPGDQDFCTLDRKAIDGYRSQRAPLTAFLLNKIGKLLRRRRKSW